MFESDRFKKIQELRELKDPNLMMQRILTERAMADAILKLGIITQEGKPGFTPVKGVDYTDGEDGYTPVKGVDYNDGEDGYNQLKVKTTMMVRMEMTAANTVKVVRSAWSAGVPAPASNESALGASALRRSTTWKRVSRPANGLPGLVKSWM